MRNNEYVYRPLQHPPLIYDFAPHECFNEDGVFGNHDGPQGNHNNAPIVDHLFPIEVPELEEEEDPMEWDEQNEEDFEEDDGVGFVFGLIPENPNTQVGVNNQAPNLLDEDDEPQGEQGVPILDDNPTDEDINLGTTATGDTRQFISEEEMLDMENDPDLCHVALNYYRTPPVFSFPLPLRMLNLEDINNPLCTNVDQSLCYFDWGCGEIGMVNGCLSWDPINYPFFDDNDRLPSDQEAYFWFGCRTVTENEIVVAYPHPFPHGVTFVEDAGPSGSASGDIEEDSMTGGTISEIPRQHPQHTNLDIIPYCPTVINVGPPDAVYVTVTSDQKKDDSFVNLFNNKLEDVWNLIAANSSLIKRAKELINDHLDMAAELGISRPNHLLEQNRKRMFDCLGDNLYISQPVKKVKLTLNKAIRFPFPLPIKKRKGVVITEIVDDLDEDVPHTNKKPKTETLAPSFEREDSLEMDLEEITHLFANLKLGFGEVVPQQPPEAP